MKPLTTKIVVIIVAAAIIAPAAYFAYIYYDKSNVSPSLEPFEYIPGNSTMISTVNSNGSEYYIFLDDNSLGIVANISSAALIDSNLTSSSSQNAAVDTNSGNIFSGANVKTTTYDSVTVYEIKNVNLTVILGKILGDNLSNSLISPDVNVFAFETSGNFVVLGEENAINASISVHATSKDAVGYKSYFNQSANISLYYKVNSTVPTISYITLNSTSNRTYVNVIPANSLDLQVDELAIKAALSSSKVTNVTGGKYTLNTSNGVIHIELYKGIESIPGILKVLNTTTI